MRQKQIFIKKIRFIIPVIVILSLLFSTGYAQTSVEELEQGISEKQQQLEQINTEIQNLQREISRRQKVVATLQNEIALFDLQIRQTEAQIQGVQLEIDKISDDILETQVSIQQKEEELEKQKRYLAETLRLINEYDHYTALEMTLGNNTFSDFLDQVQYASNLQERSQEILADIRTLKQELEDKKVELETELAEQTALKEQLAGVQHSLEQQRAGKETLLAQTRGQENLYQSLLGQAADKQEEIGREIFELEIAIRRQVGDDSLPPITGLLRWPTSGILTQGYGNTGFTSLGYNFHNGIDVAAPAGTRIYAAGDGVVYATGTGQAAYGNWIVIKHTIDNGGKVYNIYSLYAHLQGFTVSQGAVVKGGDLIGFMGNTGNTTRLIYGPERGYHLHFSIFQESGFSIKGGAYQDVYGAYQIPVGVTINPLNLLN